MNKISRAIHEQIVEEYEDLTIWQDESEPAAIKHLAKEWSMTPMEINDIIVVWKKQQENIDFTGDLGDII